MSKREKERNIVGNKNNGDKIPETGIFPFLLN